MMRWTRATSGCVVARRRPREGGQPDVSDMTPDERRDVFMRWWYAKLAAQDRADRTGDRAGFLRWLQAHPKPTPDLYSRLRDPRGRG